MQEAPGPAQANPPQVEVPQERAGGWQESSWALKRGLDVSEFDGTLPAELIEILKKPRPATG